MDYLEFSEVGEFREMGILWTEKWQEIVNSCIR